MTTYNTATKQLISNYACISTLEPTDIAVGQSITVASIGSPFNGTFTVLALPQYAFIGVDSNSGEFEYDVEVPRPNQIIYAATGSNVDYAAFYAGTVVYTQSCTWITTADLITYLGVTITNPSDDYTLAVQARNAGNDFCYRRRQESSYFDSLTTSPGHDVTLGTLMYAAALWRSRGSIETAYAAFDTMGTPTQQSLTPIVKQLLGIPRPAVA
jgi:hypothetical protein